MADIQTEAVVLFNAFAHTVLGGDPNTLNERQLRITDGTDAGVCAVYTLVFFAINWGLRLCFIEPLGTAILRPALTSPMNRKTDRAKKKLRESVEKFAQSCIELLFYGSFSVLGYLIVYNQPWSWPSKEWWTYDRSNPKFRDDLRCFYLLYCGRYTAMGLSVLMEHRRKDFLEMLIHHWVTVAVVALSYVGGFCRVGAVIMLIFDPADVPLHTAKLFKYVSDAKKGTTLGNYTQFCADRFFEVFAVVFFLMHCCPMYPYCVWSSAVESAQYTDIGTDGWICVGLLSVLLLLQFYWMYLIIAAAINMAKKGGIEDIRSDDDVSLDASPTKPKKA